MDNQLDDHARHFLYQLLGEKGTLALMEMPSTMIDNVIKQAIRERARQERKGPRSSLINMEE